MHSGDLKPPADWKHIVQAAGTTEDKEASAGIDGLAYQRKGEMLNVKQLDEMFSNF